MFMLIQDIISYLNLEKYEQFFTAFFVFLTVLLLVVLMWLMNKYLKNDSLSIYSFYRSSKDNLFKETEEIGKKLKELEKMKDEFNKLIIHTNASIEARKEIIETLQQRLNSLSVDEEKLNEKISTLNLINDKPMAINDIMNDFFKKNNKHSVKLNVIIGFVFCLLGFILSRIFA